MPHRAAPILTITPTSGGFRLALESPHAVEPINTYSTLEEALVSLDTAERILHGLHEETPHALHS